MRRLLCLVILASFLAFSTSNEGLKSTKATKKIATNKYTTEVTSLKTTTAQSKPPESSSITKNVPTKKITTTSKSTVDEMSTTELDSSDISSESLVTDSSEMITAETNSKSVYDSTAETATMKKAPTKNTKMMKKTTTTGKTTTADECNKTSSESDSSNTTTDLPKTETTASYQHTTLKTSPTTKKNKSTKKKTTTEKTTNTDDYLTTKNKSFTTNTTTEEKDTTTDQYTTLKITSTTKKTKMTKKTFTTAKASTTKDYSTSEKDSSNTTTEPLITDTSTAQTTNNEHTFPKISSTTKKTKKIKKTTTTIKTTSADDNTTEMTTVNSPVCSETNTLEPFSEAMIDFSVKCTLEVIKEQDKTMKNQSIIYSPIATMRVLALSVMHSYGLEYNRLLELMKQKNVDQVRCTMEQVNEILSRSSKVVMANGAFFSPKYQITPGFKKDVSTYLQYGITKTIQFKPPSIDAINKMNNAMKIASKGVFPEFFTTTDILDSKTQFVVGTGACINKISFKYRFSKEIIRNRFYISSTKYVTRDYVSQRVKCDYTEVPTLKAKAIRVESDIADMYYLMILSKSKTDRSSTLRRLDYNMIKSIEDSMKQTIVDIQMPKYDTIRTDIDAKEVLKRAIPRTNNIFNPKHAEFVNVVVDNKPLAISVFSQKNCLTMNYDGKPAPNEQENPPLPSATFIVQQPCIVFIMGTKREPSTGKIIKIPVQVLIMGADN